MRSRWILSSIGFLMILSSLVFAQEMPKQHSFELKWQEHGIGDSIRVPIDQKPFEKEPEFGDHSIYRGVLGNRAPVRSGKGLIEDTEPSVHGVAFIWDKTAGKLYLDLNRDGNLTNDPEGILETKNKQSEDYHRFPEFMIANSSDEGTFRYKIQPTLYGYEWQKEAHFRIVSGYGGTAELYGVKWHFGVNDRLKGGIGQDSQLTVQAIDEKPEGYSENLISSLNVPKQLFFGGHCYEVGFEFRKGDDEYPALWCTLTEKDVPQAMLRIEAGAVEQLVFGDDEMLILPPLTEGAVSVPAGDFYVKACNLKYEKDRPAVSPTDIESIAVEVADGRENVFKIGTPLQNSVRVERTGKVLKFHYELHGAGGETYSAREITNYDSSKKPTLAIYKGDMKLASGSFEYG